LPATAASKWSALPRSAAYSSDCQVAEVALVAEVRQVVLVAAPALDLPRVRQEGAGLAELVEADVGQRQVLLELRRPADPPAHPLGGDQRVVAEGEEVVDVNRRVRRRAVLTTAAVARVAHRCSTPSGTS
jgi:hypothetical protein